MNSWYIIPSLKANKKLSKKATSCKQRILNLDYLHKVSPTKSQPKDFDSFWDDADI
jgi:hypothetical protein